MVLARPPQGELIVVVARGRMAGLAAGDDPQRGVPVRQVQDHPPRGPGRVVIERQLRPEEGGADGVSITRQRVGPPVQYPVQRLDFAQAVVKDDAVYIAPAPAGHVLAPVLPQVGDCVGQGPGKDVLTRQRSPFLVAEPVAGILTQQAAKN